MPNNAIITFDRVRLRFSLCVQFIRDKFLVWFPIIRHNLLTIRLIYPLPQAPACLSSATSQLEVNELFAVSVDRRPDPQRVFFYQRMCKARPSQSLWQSHFGVYSRLLFDQILVSKAKLKRGLLSKIDRLLGSPCLPNTAPALGFSSILCQSLSLARQNIRSHISYICSAVYCTEFRILPFLQTDIFCNTCFFHLPLRYEKSTYLTIPKNKEMKKTAKKSKR